MEEWSPPRWGRPQAETSWRKVAVDQYTTSRFDLAELPGRGERLASDRFRRRSYGSSVIADLRDVGASFIADEPADVVEGGCVGDSGEDDFGSVVVDHGLSEGAVAGL